MRHKLAGCFNCFEVVFSGCILVTVFFIWPIYRLELTIWKSLNANNLFGIDRNCSCVLDHCNRFIRTQLLVSRMNESQWIGYEPLIETELTIPV